MYDGTMVLDIHGHVVSPPAFSALAQRLTILRTPPDQPFVMADELVERFCQEHLRYLDDRNIDVQFVSPRPVSMMHWETPTLQRAWCRATNDLLAQQHRLHPDRIWGVAQLPQTVTRDTSVVIDELERCFTEHKGFVGAVVNPDPGGDNKYQGMNDETWFPLYEKAQELDVTLIVHPAFSRDPRTEFIPHNYQLNFLIHEAMATQILGHGQVFDIFPRLKVVVCHCGGALSRFLNADPHNPQQDRTKNLFFDTCSYDPIFMEAAIKQKGVNRMLFGTEAPGSGRYPNPETGRPVDDLVPVIGGFDWLSADDKKDIFNNNIKRVFTHFEQPASITPATPIQEGDPNTWATNANASPARS
jgi:predicted TIM-barrel fold metal-dependent hydrolase